MGTGSSRPTSATGSASGSGGDRPNFRLTSLLCGTSFSDDPPCQIQDQSNDTAAPPIVVDEQQNSVKEPPLTVREGKNPLLSSKTSTQGQSSSGSVSKRDMNSGSSTENSNSMKHFSDSKKVSTIDPSVHISESMEFSHCGKHDNFSGRNGDQQFPSTKTLPFGSSSITREATSSLMAEAGGSVVGSDPQLHSEQFCRASLSQQEYQHVSSSEVLTTGNQVVEPARDEPVRETESLGTGLDRDTAQGDRRSVLQVDVSSISSDILTSSHDDYGNHETRRNSRRLFRDALSRGSSRRDDDMPSIILSAGSTHGIDSRGRWPLDFRNDSDSFENGAGNETISLSRRRHGSHGNRWRSRSEAWGRFRGGHYENSGDAILCSTGLHPEGTCLCESFLMAEISSARSSISRIVLLAEALFEVLDEIHRQPDSFPFSMMPHPAQESVVNSFPVKNYTKSDILGNGEVEQCYICLAEYEEEDVIRILPCRHEYHMACVDKWLKEIHGVCPLCRRDVYEGIDASPSSSS